MDQKQCKNVLIFPILRRPDPDPNPEHWNNFLRWMSSQLSRYYLISCQFYRKIENGKIFRVKEILKGKGAMRFGSGTFKLGGSSEIYNFFLRKATARQKFISNPGISEWLSKLPARLSKCLMYSTFSMLVLKI
jgi:hypothetical protein